MACCYIIISKNATKHAKIKICILLSICAYVLLPTYLLVYVAQYTLYLHCSLASTMVCACRSVFPDQLEIVQSYSRASLPQSVAEIGRELRINFTVANDGPSTIGQGRLTIHLPYRTPCTRNSFLFYILSVSV